MKTNPFLLFSVGIACLIAGVFPATAQESETLAIQENMPRVVLNQLVYQDSDSVTATVTFVHAGDVSDAVLALIFAGSEPNNEDVEAVNLQATADPLVYETEIPLVTKTKSGGVTKLDGTLELAPNEIFSAMLGYKYSDRTQSAGDDGVAADWGLFFDDSFADAGVEVEEGMALTDDELNPPPGMRKIGTLYFKGDVGPVQIASEELLFRPESDAQLTAFLSRTGGVVMGFEGSLAQGPGLNLPDAGSAWLRVKMQGDPTKIPQLPQLRSLLGESETLCASNEATLALVASATELWMEGFLVGLNPRSQLHGSLSWPEHLIPIERERTTPEGDTETYTELERIDSFGRYPTDTHDRNAAAIREENFGVRQMWAFMAMFDYDRTTVPVGVIDSGFAPNPDFKTSDPLYAETNLGTGARGIGSAQVPQEVGNSFFGDKTWHGNGTVTTISGQGNNRYGTAGTGAQTAVPMLYHMGLANFALDIGTAIRMAVDDGASVVNISAGYPCRILSVLGNDDICSEAGRTAFILKLGLAVRAAAAAACAAGGLLDIIIPGLGAVTCATAIGAAETAATHSFAALFLGEVRGPVERGVAYATAAGVPIVASAGNRLSAAAMGPLAEFVNIDNSNIDDWQVIPAVIPDVIAVGACNPGDHDVWNGSGFNFYANLHFWGDSVDLWAPLGTFYWAPEPGDVSPSTIPAADHIQRPFGGTSNAAPFITGIIANLMAVNSQLDRRFAPVSERPMLPGRIRDLLVDTAHQAGDPTAPDSADDRMLFVWNEETGMHEEIEEPPQLLADMVNRRNYVNAWAATWQAAQDAGVLDYPGLGYETDLGRTDRLEDASAPGGVREPRRAVGSSFLEAEEINACDRDFWWARTPSENFLYQIRYEVTIPRSESPLGFLMNGVAGTLASLTTEEQTLAWVSPPLWWDSDFGTRLSCVSGEDSIYRIATILETQDPPDEDHHDETIFGNDTLNDAAVLPTTSWGIVPPRGALEVKAWELCEAELNFHEPDDVDVFRIGLPVGATAPSSCGGVDPWISVSVDPPSTALRLKVFSRAGGTDTLLARGNGADVLRLDCLDFLGHLPLYVQVENAGNTFVEYALKVRYSEPDEELADRLELMREHWAIPRDLSFFENFFRPEVPWLRNSPGLLPPSLVNPNPLIDPILNDNGQFESSRLFFFDVPADDLDVSFAALLGEGQSLRMEILDLDGTVLGMASTPDLQNNGQLRFAGLNQNESGPTRLTVSAPQSPIRCIYVLRLSGHRPGDEIALYLSRDLLPQGAFAWQDLDAQGNGVLSLLPTLFGAEDSFLQSSPDFPALDPGDFSMAPACHLEFQADAETGYVLEYEESGVWKRSGSPMVFEQAQTVSAFLPCPPTGGGGNIRIGKLGGGGTFSPSQLRQVNRMLFQTTPGTQYTLMGNAGLGESTWNPYGAEPEFTGDGGFFEWFLDPSIFTEDRYFFEVRW